MKRFTTVVSLVLFVVGFSSCASEVKSPAFAESKAFGYNFVKIDSANPVLTPNPATGFFSPLRKDTVRWEEKDVFNPAAVVKDGKIFLLYRAEDHVGKYKGTSRIGLAFSDDGLHFERLKTPVLYPDNDFMKVYEWEGGVEDPRVVETENGEYVMTYTSWDGKIARLCVAISKDMIKWEKKGLAFAQFADGKYKDLWSKSGAIVATRKGDQIVATRINGKYWMYWGDTDIFLATSADLIHWQPVESPDGELRPIIQPRDGYFDSELVESGPPAMITDQGILLIYNSKNVVDGGDPNLAEGTYAAGWAYMDLANPAEMLKRSEHYFIHPDKPYEITGQVNEVCFVEGLAFLKGKAYLYYGTADSKIAVAVSEL